MTARDLPEKAEMDAQREQAVERLCIQLGYLLRMARVNRGITIDDLAAIVREPVMTLKKLERGDLPNAGLRLIGSVCWALDVDLNLSMRDRPSPVTEEPEHPNG